MDIDSGNGICPSVGTLDTKIERILGNIINPCDQRSCVITAGQCRNDHHRGVACAQCDRCPAIGPYIANDTRSQLRTIVHKGINRNVDRRGIRSAIAVADRVGKGVRAGMAIVGRVE